jgi:hypothetical protein
MGGIRRHVAGLFCAGTNPIAKILRRNVRILYTSNGISERPGSNLLKYKDSENWHESCCD